MATTPVCTVCCTRGRNSDSLSSVRSSVRRPLRQFVFLPLSHAWCNTHLIMSVRVLKKYSTRTAAVPRQRSLLRHQDQQRSLPRDLVLIDQISLPLLTRGARSIPVLHRTHTISMFQLTISAETLVMLRAYLAILTFHALIRRRACLRRRSKTRGHQTHSPCPCRAYTAFPRTLPLPTMAGLLRCPSIKVVLDADNP